MLKNITTIFKSIYLTFFLIFSLSFISRLQVYLYHSSIAGILRLQTLFLVMLAFISLLLALLFSVIFVLLRIKDKKQFKFVNFLCFLAFTLSYGYAFLSMDKSSHFLNTLWSTGILPLAILITVLLLFIKHGNKLNNFIAGFQRKIWAPIFAILIVSLLFITGILGSLLFYRYNLTGDSSISKTINKSLKMPNVILITLDALTTRDMSLYGYSVKTTPNMEKLAAESYVFDNMFTNFCSTTPSILSLFTSKYPSTHKIYLPGKYLKSGREESLFTLMNEFEIGTIIGTFYANPILVGLNTGKVRVFDTTNKAKLFSQVDFLLNNLLGNTIPINELPLLSGIMPVRDRDRTILGRRPRHKNDYLTDPKKTFIYGLSAIKQMDTTPFFLWIHCFPPNGLTASPPFLNTLTDKGYTIPKDLQINGKYDIARQAEVDKLRARYDESIMETDYSLGKFIETLKHMGLYDNTILIVTSDHGESNEKGWRGHFSECLYNGTTNVPLIIHLPGQVKGKRIWSPAETVDIAPSILELLGKKIPDHMEGESLIPYMLNTDKITSKPKYCIWYNDQNKDDIQISAAVIAKDHKLIYNVLENKGELYKLEDKNEENNLFNKERNIAQELIGEIPKIEN